MQRPNVIWVIPDDTNHGMLGFNGGKVLSPNLDSIAENGVVLSQFHCSSPACAPSRYSYLTGHYCGRCPSPGFRDEGDPRDPYRVFFNTPLEPERELSLGHALQRAGYRTGHVGKWHAGGSPEDLAALPKFDLDDDPRDPAVAAQMKAHQEGLCEIVRKAGFDYAQSVVFGNYETLPMAARNHNIEWITKGGLDFIDQCAGEGVPFFLSMATTTIHGPNHVSSLLADPHLTAGGYSDDHLGCQASRQSIYERIAKAEGVSFNSTTAGVLWMDDAVGAVLARLRELGIEDDTVVIFSGDHGPSIGGKFTTYQRGTRIPFIAQWKRRVPPGRTVDALAQNVDFVPALLGIVGGEIPDGMVVDGQSLFPLLTGEALALPGRDSLYFEFGHTRAIRTERWKYIAWRPPESLIREIESGEMDTLCTHFGRPIRLDLVSPDLITASLLQHPHYFEPDQLYDLESDPYERANLASDPQHAQVLEEMRSRLGGVLDTFDRPFPLSAPSEFLSSPRFQELLAKVRQHTAQERKPWEDDMAYIGFSDTETMPPRCPV